MTETTNTNTRGRVPIFLYGMAAYLLFLATFLYTIGFVINVAVPKSIDMGEVGTTGQAVLINVVLLSLFAIQHTIMARPVFKAWWTKIIPEPAERSTFVLATCVTLILMFWQWRPMPESVWHVTNEAPRIVLYAVYAFGFVVVLYSTFCIDHFGLFGLRQVIANLRGRPCVDPEFVNPWLYRLVRNPLMLGFVIAFWATPDMTQGHLLFAIVTTGYVFFGIAVEERDLLAKLGDDYRDYRARTPMIFPWPRPRAAKPSTAVTN